MMTRNNSCTASKWRFWGMRSDNNGKNDPTSTRMTRVIELMHEDLSIKLSVEQMASTSGMSITGFRKGFKRFTGQSPKAFYDDLRMRTAREMLRMGLFNVTQVAEKTGFCDAGHSSKSFHRHFGSPPSQTAHQARFHTLIQGLRLDD